MGIDYDKIASEKKEEQKHREITDALSTIAKAIEEDKTQKIEEILSIQSSRLKELVLAIEKKPQEIDNNFVSLLKENMEVLNKTLEHLQKPEVKKKWVFNVQRDQDGLINSIIATNN